MFVSSGSRRNYKAGRLGGCTCNTQTRARSSRVLRLFIEPRSSGMVFSRIKDGEEEEEGGLDASHGTMPIIIYRSDRPSYVLRSMDRMNRNGIIYIYATTNNPCYPRKIFERVKNKLSNLVEN